MNNNEFPFNHFFTKENLSNTPHNPIPLKSSTTSTDGVGTKNKTEASESAYSSKDLELLSLEIKNHIKHSISSLKFNLYFQKTFAVSKITEKEIFFQVQSNYVKNQIEDSFTTLISNAISSILGLNLKLIFISNDSNETPPIPELNSTLINNEVVTAPNNDDTPRSVKEATFKLELTPTTENLHDKAESKYLKHIGDNNQSSIIDPNKTFNTFIIGPSNNMAFVTMRAVAEEPSRPNKPGRYPSIYIYSNSGLGKTHLLHSVANKIFEDFPSLNLCLITAREFMKEMIESIQNNTLGLFQKKYSEKIDVLMIDDIHELENKHGTQNEFFHIFNELHNKGKQLIFTSDKPPKEIDGIAERIRTRLQWG